MMDGGPNVFEQAKDKAQDIETKALQVWTSDVKCHLVACLHHNTCVNAIAICVHAIDHPILKIRSGSSSRSFH